MVIAKMKISAASYFRNWIGYDIVCLPARPYSADRAQGGVGLVSWDRLTVWSLESTRFHGPNMVSSEILTGTSRTATIGAYLLLPMLAHLPNI